MNVFELAIIAAPAAGLAAGVNAAAGERPLIVAACAAGGLLVGAAAYAGPVSAAVIVWSRVRDPHAPPERERPGPVEWLAGISVVLFAGASPVLAWFAASFSLSALLGTAP